MSERFDEDRIRHLEMLQGAISRMANAAGAVKNLCLVVVAGSLAFIAASKEPTVALFASVLTAAFWFLDARYLQQEKWFRDMYDAERHLTPAEPASFRMTPAESIRSRTSLAYGLKSWSTWGLYAPLIVFLLVVWLTLVCVSTQASGGCSNG